MLWFDYALIKYSPDPRRGETINIGLVVFLPETLDVRMLNASAKIRILDGTSTQTDIEAFKSALKTLPVHDMDTDARYAFLRTLFTDIVFLSEKGRFAIDLETQYESKIGHLFDTLVKPCSFREKQISHSRLFTKLKSTFRTQNILARDASELSQHKVVASYTLDQKTGITADFLVKNGVYHISEVIDFNVNDIQAKFKETSLKTMTFLTGKKELGENSRCYFVYNANAEKEKEIMAHLNMAEDYSDKMFNLASNQEMKSYLAMINEITQTTHPVFH